MKRREYRAYRVSDGSETVVTGLIPENEEDQREIERLDELGEISRGDTFHEQREHAKIQEQRGSQSLD